MGSIHSDENSQHRYRPTGSAELYTGTPSYNAVERRHRQTDEFGEAGYSTRCPEALILWQCPSTLLYSYDSTMARCSGFVLRVQKQKSTTGTGSSDRRVFGDHTAQNSVARAYFAVVANRFQ